MPQAFSAYPEVNRKWKAVAKMLLGADVGEMKEYEKWLSDIVSPRTVHHDSSGKEIVLVAPHYSQGAKWLSFEDVHFEKEYAPLSINDLKDIDSILRAVSERIYYTGNIILGNSDFVEKSTGVIDSFYIYHSDRLAHCKYLAYCTQATASEHMFGCNGFGSTSFSIRIHGTMYSSRCFEASKCEYSTDCYYSHGLASCASCMFCFNLRSKRHCIGSLQLSPEKYSQLKAKLVSEMGEILLKEKRLPSLLELCDSPLQDPAEVKRLVAGMGKRKAAEKTDAPAIERAFSETAKLVLGQEHAPIDKYGKWLNQCTAKLEQGASCVSGAPVLVPEYIDFMLFPRHRLVTQEEADFLGERLQLAQSETEGLDMKNAGQAISKIAFFCPEWTLGMVQNIIGAQVNFDSSSCYRNILNINSKYTGFGFWARDSEHLFGGNEVRYSSFCINCYHSEKLQRCFEVDASRDCADCYYCHNCENVRDSMFCFNTKNKRYAIGNAELPREKYLEVKKRVLAQLNNQLSRGGKAGYSIFKLAQAKRN